MNKPIPLELPARSRAWFRQAVVYFSLGVGLGVVMGASGDHSLFPLHAHINLLGWVTMTLFGLIGVACPAVAEGRLATVQFWLHSLGLPVLCVTLGLKLKGYAQVEPLLGLASMVVGLGVLLFAWQVLARLGSQRRGAASAEGIDPAAVAMARRAGA